MNLSISKQRYIELRNQGIPQQQILEKYSVKTPGEQINAAANSVTDFFGGRGIADSLGTGLAASQTNNPDALDNINANAPTKAQALGSVLQTSSNLFPLKTAATGITSAASVLAPKLAPKLGLAAAGASAGYMADVGAKLQSKSDTPFTPGLGTALGATIPTAAMSISSAIKTLSSKTPETQLIALSEEFKSVRNAFNDNSIYKNINGKRVLSRDPITTLSNEKIVPDVMGTKISVTSAQEKLIEKISALAEANTRAVSASTAIAPLDTALNEAITAVKKNNFLKATGSVQKTISKIQTVFDDFKTSYGENLPADAIDEIRKAMNKVYNPDELDAARAIGNAMRKLQYDLVPQSRPILQKEGELIAASEFLRSLDGRVVNRGRLGTYFSQVIGAIAGSTTDIPVVGPVVGAMGARAIAQRIAGSYFKPIGSGAARAITNASSRIGTPTTPGDMMLQSAPFQRIVTDLKNAQPGLSIQKDRI